MQESEGDHRHERMTVQSLPGSTLEVIETKFFFQLLVSLLANPSRLDGGRERAQVSLRRQVGEIVFLLSRHPVFADQPSLVAGQMLLSLVPDPLRRSVGNSHADRSDAEDHVPDEVYEQVRKFFTEKELVDLTPAITEINSWNRLNIATRAVPGAYQPAKARELKRGAS